MLSSSYSRTAISGLLELKLLNDSKYRFAAMNLIWQTDSLHYCPVIIIKANNFTAGWPLEAQFPDNLLFHQGNVPEPGALICSNLAPFPAAVSVLLELK